MGLCKCPKRRVTNQFCFEHRVNVCEHCMVTNHPKCIVQSYLQWLQDSDYSPVCELCSKDLASEECVRLICYHVYHWSCLDRMARALPATTAPAGYACPSCRVCVFPPANLVSAVADVLAQRLAGVNWARAGLGLPLLSEEREPVTQAIRELPSQATPPATAPLMHSVVHVDDGTFSRADSVGQAPRRGARPVSPIAAPTRLRDHDDDKYKRRSAAELVGRWSKSWLGVGARGRPPPRRRWVVALAALAALALLVVLFSWAGARATRDDPSFDPHHNPNIRIAELPA